MKITRTHVAIVVLGVLIFLMILGRCYVIPQ